ncbi:hypothetical protein [Staphylococcus sp. LKG3-3]|uniref:hypothetical protein n=1 Tax=Staphylococcus sp. LKG3-3 TaxID=3399685 RepID=UPI003D48E92F
MKIKTKKTMNLPQLIEWAWENGMRGEIFLIDSNQEAGIHFDGDCDFKMHNADFIRNNDFFTIEVEEEITEDRILPALVAVRKQHFASGNYTIHVTKINNKSINALIDKQPINSTFEYKEIYLMDDDKLGQCIWRDGKLVE